MEGWRVIFLLLTADFGPLGLTGQVSTSTKKYYYISEPKTWMDAQNYCTESLNGTLFWYTPEVKSVLYNYVDNSTAVWTQTLSDWMTNVGCFENKGAKSNATFPHNSPVLCQLFCSDSDYIAVQGNQCFCMGKNSPIYNADNFKCSRKCFEHDLGELCGGSNTASVYKVDKTTKIHNEFKLLLYRCMSARCSEGQAIYEPRSCLDKFRYLCSRSRPHPDLESSGIWRNSSQHCEIVAAEFLHSSTTDTAYLCEQSQVPCWTGTFRNFFYGLASREHFPNFPCRLVTFQSTGAFISKDCSGSKHPFVCETDNGAKVGSPKLPVEQITIPSFGESTGSTEKLPETQTEHAHQQETVKYVTESQYETTFPSFTNHFTHTIDTTDPLSLPITSSENATVNKSLPLITIALGNTSHGTCCASTAETTSVLDKTKLGSSILPKYKDFSTTNHIGENTMKRQSSGNPLFKKTVRPLKSTESYSFTEYSTESSASAVLLSLTVDPNASHKSSVKDGWIHRTESNKKHEFLSTLSNNQEHTTPTALWSTHNLTSYRGDLKPTSITNYGSTTQTDTETPGQKIKTSDFVTPQEESTSRKNPALSMEPTSSFSSKSNPDTTSTTKEASLSSLVSEQEMLTESDMTTAYISRRVPGKVPKTESNTVATSASVTTRYEVTKPVANSTHSRTPQTTLTKDPGTSSSRSSPDIKTTQNSNTNEKPTIETYLSGTGIKTTAYKDKAISEPISSKKQSTTEHVPTLNRNLTSLPVSSSKKELVSQIESTTINNFEATSIINEKRTENVFTVNAESQAGVSAIQRETSEQLDPLTTKDHTPHSAFPSKVQSDYNTEAAFVATTPHQGTKVPPVVSTDHTLISQGTIGSTSINIKLTKQPSGTTSPETVMLSHIHLTNTLEHNTERVSIIRQNHLSGSSSTVNLPSTFTTFKQNLEVYTPTAKQTATTLLNVIQKNEKTVESSSISNRKTTTQIVSTEKQEPTSQENYTLNKQRDTYNSTTSLDVRIRTAIVIGVSSFTSAVILFVLIVKVLYKRSENRRYKEEMRQKRLLRKSQHHKLVQSQF